MNTELALPPIIYSLLFAALMFAVSGVIIRRRLMGRARLFEKIFGPADFKLNLDSDETKKRRIKLNLESVFPKSYIDRLKNQLSKSGKMGTEALTGTLRRKFLYGALAFLLGTFYFLPSGSILQLVLATLFGFFLPDILITNSIQKRAETIAQALPDAVEMLTMCVDAGLSFQQSLKRVSENQNTVISNEFARVMSEIQIGEPRSVALANMGARLNHHDVNKFVSAMLQVDRLGIPISSVLREQVTELRSRSRMRARERAQKVPVKILGPVMACFMPCTLIIVLGPVILQFIS